MKCAASLSTDSSGKCCGHTANADVIGARNILAAGHAVLACRGAVRPPDEAGPHRNDSGDSLNVAGFHVLQGVEDVKQEHMY